MPCHSIPFSSCSLWGGSWICWPFHHWQRRRHMNCLGCIHRQSYFKVNVMYNGQPANRIWKSNIFESTLQEQFCPGDIRSASANRLWIIYVYYLHQKPQLSRTTFQVGDTTSWPEPVRRSHANLLFQVAMLIFSVPSTNVPSKWLGRSHANLLCWPHEWTWMHWWW